MFADNKLLLWEKYICKCLWDKITCLNRLIYLHAQKVMLYIGFLSGATSVYRFYIYVTYKLQFYVAPFDTSCHSRKRYLEEFFHSCMVEHVVHAVFSGHLEKPLQFLNSNSRWWSFQWNPLGETIFGFQVTSLAITQMSRAEIKWHQNRLRKEESRGKMIWEKRKGRIEEKDKNIWAQMRLDTTEWWY